MATPPQVSLRFWSDCWTSFATNPVTTVTRSGDGLYGLWLSCLVNSDKGPFDRERVNMHLSEWSKSEVEYGRKVLNSGLEGVRSGREAFLNGRPLTPFFRESLIHALKPAALAAGVAMLTSCPANRRRSVSQVLKSGLVGGLIGLGAGVVWESRFLAASAAGCAAKSIGKARDEHWFETHPIDYA